MNGKFRAGLVAILVLAGLAARETLAGTVDFESTTAGTYTQLVFPDLKITHEAGDFKVIDILNAPGGGNISPYLTGTAITLAPTAKAFVATFLTGTADYFRVAVGDYGLDDDYLKLAAYDGNGNQVGSTVSAMLKASDGPSGAWLTITRPTADISYVRFWAEDNDTWTGDVFWDNISYSVVPLPAAAWMGLATLGLVLGARRLRRRNR